MTERHTAVLDEILDLQKRSWSSGSRPPVEDFLRHSKLENDTEALLDLIYNEVLVREELGEEPVLEDYIPRFPHLADDLKLHFEVHRAVNGNGLVDTQRVQYAELLAENRPALEYATNLKDYELIAQLGQGGMGVVYKAQHRLLHRLVALKMFQPGRLPSSRELLRFHTEAEAIARLQHPNIVQIFEIGQLRGLPFIVLELVEKGTLATRLQELPFAPRAAALLIETLARAIHHAHEQHIVHRDLKPANVLFAKDGTPKITDFGLAKILEEGSDAPRDATRSGEPIGTPRYMAPEQAAGHPEQIGPATDIYGLGTLLYECLTGQVPFVAAGVMETMTKILNDEPRSPRQLQPTIPRDLATICLKCLRKQPAQRYPSALALAEDLRRFLNGEPIQARPTPAWKHLWLWCRRRPAQAVLAATGILLILAGFIAFGFWKHYENQRLDRLRDAVAGLVNEGHEALERHDLRQARKKFLEALGKIVAEPGLRPYELGAAGWLDHALREAEQQRWQQRNPPPLFDELRDEAFIQCVLLDPREPEFLPIARQAIHAALALTVAEDLAWRKEREELALLEADLVLRTGDAATALDILDQDMELASSLWRRRRAECLVRLDRKSEADQENLQAEKFPPVNAFEFFLSGVDRFQRQDLPGAVKDFDKTLTLEPNHFTGRFFQAACFLKQKRPGEAKVALTACIGQRPTFVWNFLFRGWTLLQLGDNAAAAHDFQRALDLMHAQANEHQPQRVRLKEQYLDHALAALNKAIETLPKEDRIAFWGMRFPTDSGLKPLGELPLFQKMVRFSAEKKTNDHK